MARGKQEWYPGHPRDAEDSVLASMALDQFVVLLLTYLIKKCYGRKLEGALTKVYLQAAKVGRKKQRSKFQCIDLSVHLHEDRGYDSHASQGPIPCLPICCFVLRYHSYNPVHCRQQSNYCHLGKPAERTGPGRSMRMEHMDKNEVGGHLLFRKAGPLPCSFLTAENSEKAVFEYR